MKTVRTLVLAAVAFGTLNFAEATTVIPPTFDQLVDEAELIFQGTCTDVKSQWVGEGGERHIVTYVTFKVEDALKGTPGDSYTIRMLGGTVDGTTMEVTDTPKFKVGKRDILFVQQNGKQFVPLVGIMHGRYRVEQDQATGHEVILDDHGRGVSDVAKLGKGEHIAPGGVASAAASAAGASEQALTPADFKAAIKAKLGAQK
jgi:hypothetical protein